MRLFKVIGILLLMIISSKSSAQSDTVTVVTEEYCKPGVRGAPIGKGALVEYQRVFNIAISTEDKTGNFSNTNDKIKSNSSIEAKLKIPVINKPHLNIIAGLNHTFEEYHFENPDVNPLYKNLEDKGLNSIGVNLNIVKPTKTKRFWVLRTRADLNGDYDSANSNLIDYLKFSIAPAMGKKVNDDFSYSVGVSLNYRFGSPIVIPIVALNKNLNEKWTVESILPLFVKTRYKPNPGLFWLNTFEIDGASYKLNNFSEEFSDYSNLHLHRSSIQYNTRIEKKVIRWIWTAAELGIRKNIRHNLTNSNRSRKNVIFESTLKSAFFFNVSLFISPSKRL